MSIPKPVIPKVDARQNLRWLFVLRNLMICGESVAIFLCIHGLDIPLRESPLWGIVTVMCLFNWWTWVRLGSDEPIVEMEVFVQLSFDVLVIAAILFFTGGATNPLAWFFLLPLIIAATVLTQEYTWYMVFFTSGCYTLLMGFYQPLPDIQPVTLHTEAGMVAHSIMQGNDLKLHVFGMWFGFVFSAVLVAYFVVEMANTLRERDRRLAEVREQNLRSERVVALGTLAAGAAHEMGTPLGIMAILIHEIEGDYVSSTNRDLRQKMSILKEQLARCKKALSVMSASAGEIRAESGSLMSLEAYLDSVVETWRRQQLNKNLIFRKSGVRPAPNILAEQTLTMSLINILNNAAEVSPEGVELIVKWGVDRIDISILDQGPGIAPAVSDRIGKVPVSTKDQGLGVGLFLAFATIERLGGRIELVPRAKKVGTCTHIVLPVVS